MNSECKHCHRSTPDVALRPSFTAYPEGGNEPIPLCDPCFEEHRDHWQEMWGEVEGGMPIYVRLGLPEDPRLKRIMEGKPI